jgi:VWFA-related protein
LFLTAAVVPALLLTVAAAARPAGEATTRTLFVTVTDGKGAAVTDLTAADFAVKEGGKAREIASAEPAKTRMRTAIMLDERLLSDGSTRMGIFEFMKRLQPASEFAIITVGLRNTTVVDYTSDLNTIVAAINKFTLNPGTVSNFGEGLLDFSKKLVQQRPPRPVIVALALPSGGGDVGGGEVNETLNALRQTGVMLNAVTFASNGGAGEQIIEEGAKQSGGRRTEVGVPTAIPKALGQIADDLSSQYQITYTLPDGVKPDKKVAVTVSRKGVTLRAPTGMPDK